MVDKGNDSASRSLPEEKVDLVTKSDYPVALPRMENFHRCLGAIAGSAPPDRAIPARTEALEGRPLAEVLRIMHGRTLETVGYAGDHTAGWVGSLSRRAASRSVALDQRTFCPASRVAIRRIIAILIMASEWAVRRS